tara:strand:- start:429 stop:575 length:147 start_codon:yes stop_codon:yes gene_type:complete
LLWGTKNHTKQEEEKREEKNYIYSFKLILGEGKERDYHETTMTNNILF